MSWLLLADYVTWINVASESHVVLSDVNMASGWSIVDSYSLKTKLNISTFACYIWNIIIFIILLPSLGYQSEFVIKENTNKIIKN